MDQDEVFMSNLKGSAAANIVTGMFVLCLWILKNKCKHSQCKMNNRCFQCSIKEDDSECDLERGQRESEKNERQTRKDINKIEKRLQKMYESINDGLFQKHQTAIPTD